MTVYVREVAAELAKLGVRTDVFTRATSDERHPTEIFPGVRVVPIEAGPRRPVPKEEGIGYIPAFVEGVRAFAISGRSGYDAIHSHYWQSGLVGSRLATVWGVPFVHSSHTLGRVKNRFLAPDDSPEPPQRVTGEVEVIAAADVLVTSTDHEQSQLIELYDAPRERLTTIHPGVDHGAFTPGSRTVSRRRQSWEPHEKVILFVGRIQPLKGLDLAIEALAVLTGTMDPPPRLVVVGGASGPTGESEVDRLKTLAGDLGVAHLVDLLGPLPHRLLPDVYRSSDVAVVCSWSESFGLAALEAHACAIPVVATDVGGLSHIVMDGGSGFLVDRRDPRLFAGGLAKLLRDDDLSARFAATALQRADDFSWQETAASLLELYDCLVEERLPEACVC